MKKKQVGRDVCTADEFIAFLQEKEKNPTVAVDRIGLERRTAAWNSEWRSTGLDPLQSSKDIFETPGRLVEFSPKGGVIERPLIFFDKPTGEFFEHRSRGTSFLNKLSDAGVEYAIIDLEAENWARSKLSGRVLKSNGEIVNRAKE